MLRPSACLLACMLASSCTTGGGGTDAGPQRPDAGSRDAGSDAGLGHLVFFDQGLDASIIARFGGALPATDEPPAVLYPEDGTLVPPNLTGLDVHFARGAFDTFEVTFAQGGEPSVVVYAYCHLVRGGCVLQPWREVWAALAERRFRGPYAVHVRGLAGDRVSAPSAPVTLELAQEPIDGALYFWSTNPPSIRRYDFALGRRSSELFLAQATEGTCVGCHAISRDGSRIAVGIHDDDSGFRSRVYDVATRTPILPSELDAPLPSYGASDDILLSGSPPPADGRDRPLRIVDGSDGSLLHDFGVSGLSADWSPDGERIVFDGPVEGGRELHLIERADGGWLEPTLLPTPETEDERAPSFAPDSTWIGYTARDASGPVIVARDGERAVVLRRAAAGADATWLRWNPHPYEQAGRWIYWLTFSSGRGSGVHPPGRHQIWMAAFDPEADPDDPSRPAFRLPAQRADADNFIAEWTLRAHRQPCETDDDCPDGEICRDGFCIPEGPE